MKECYVRPIVFRGYGAAGVNPLPSPVEVAIAAVGIASAAAVIVADGGAVIGMA